MAPSYSLNNIAFTTLAGAYRFGGNPLSIEEVNIELESDSGRDFIYHQFQKRVFRLNYRVTTTQLATHQAMHALVKGGIEFYLSVSGAGAGDSVKVRKMSGFDPQEIDQPLGNEPGFDLTHIFKEILP